jgi:hypothetical protein
MMEIAVHELKKKSRNENLPATLFPSMLGHKLVADQMYYFI